MWCLSGPKSPWNQPFPPLNCFCRVSGHSASKWPHQAYNLFFHFPVPPKFQQHMYLPGSLPEFSVMFPASAILWHFSPVSARWHAIIYVPGRHHHHPSPGTAQPLRAGRETTLPGTHITPCTGSCPDDTNHISCIIISEMSRVHTHTSIEQRFTDWHELHCWALQTLEHILLLYLSLC